MRNFFLPLCFSGMIFLLSCQNGEPPSIPGTNINLFVTESLNPDSPFYACGEHLWTRHAWQWGSGETVFWHLQNVGRPLPIEISVNGLKLYGQGWKLFCGLSGSGK
ncbi:hypothetical protein KAH55_05415 [bacterium]|nr:hypothetical protein [bacterium]